MRRYIYKVTVLLSFFYVSCDNANDLLNDYIKDGPIIYAAKVDSMIMQSGYYRLRVNIFPAEDVNRSHTTLSWNVTSGIKDSVRMEYTEENYDENLGCYYTTIDLSSDEIQGNLLVEAHNTDGFGNRSLISNESAYIYGPVYLSTLTNSSLSFSSDIDTVYFESKINSVGNVISYENKNGEFTQEVFVAEASFPIVNAKEGAIIRTKTKYLIDKTDIDTLITNEYLETAIPAKQAKMIPYNIEALTNYNYAYHNKNRDYDTYGIDPKTGIPNDGNFHNSSLGPETIFNGNTTENAFYGYKFVTSSDELIQTFYTSYNLNVDVRLTRFKMYPRTWEGYAYKNGSIKRFRIWGTNDANQDRFAKFPETWTLIGEYDSGEPVDRNNLTPQELEYFQKNNEFMIEEDNVNPNANPNESFRYMRVELIESYDKNSKFYVLNELEMYGEIDKYY